MNRIWWLVALLFTGSAWAQSTCYLWGTVSGQQSNSANTWIETYYIPNLSSLYDWTNEGCDKDAATVAFDTTTCHLRGVRKSDGLVVTPSQGVGGSGLLAESCPPPPPCDADIGDGYWVVGSSPITGASWCDGQCKMVAGTSSCGGPSGLTTCTTWAAVQDLACGGGGSGSGPNDPAHDPPAGSTPDGDASEGDANEPGEAPESCSPVGDGEYCASPNGGGQCGYMNDTYICLEKIVEGECVGLSDGGRVCDGDAGTTPPVPDSGTPGQLAEPDGQLSNTPANPDGSSGGVTNIYNYYSSGTVGGSARDPGTTGAAPTGGSPGYDPDRGEGSGSGGDGECEGGETCGEGVPELEDVGTMTEALQAFWADLQAVPIIEAVTGIAPSFGSGSCPTWSDSVSVYGESWDVDFSMICTTWDDVSPVLSLICLVFFGLVAVRILMSA